ncbi:hypothetical protein [Candidimonas nitroreducens]|uniref:Uncharacterized protein n=1 Tax=Candidimonas nitroreducens TaxID=683354 RepID=A0A225MKV4_9BURK|nr:hypothetical protein [Candidimonas nitroreducens]OWT61878.1 hypothetical protein CEY11_08580 [Candidimonas nitroreducens]
MGVFVVVVILAAAVIIWVNQRSRPHVIAVDLHAAFEAFVYADKSYDLAQKAETAGDLSTAFAHLCSAMHQTVVAAHLAKTGTPPPDSSIDEEASLIQTIESGRPFLRSLGINDGLWTDLTMMQISFDESRKVDRHRAIALLYACRTENARVAELYFGPQRTWGKLRA